MADLTSNHSEIIPTEYIEANSGGLAKGLNLIDPTIMLIADTGTVPNGSGGVVDVPWPDDYTVPTGNKAEGAEAPIVDSGVSKASVASGEVAWSYRTPRKLQNHAVVSKMRSNMSSGVQKMGRRIDSDGLSLVTSAANTDDQSGNDCTEARFLSTKFLFEALEPELGAAGAAFIAGSTQFQNWHADLNTNGGNWTSSPEEAKSVSNLVKGLGRAFKGSRHGIAMVQTNGLPTTGANRHCAFAAIGKDSSPFLYRNWEPMTAEVMWEQPRTGWLQTLSVEYGWAKGRDSELYEVIFDNS